MLKEIFDQVTPAWAFSTIVVALLVNLASSFIFECLKKADFGIALENLCRWLLTIQLVIICVLGTYVMLPEIQRGQYLALLFGPVLAGTTWYALRTTFLTCLYFANIAWLMVWLLRLPTVDARTEGHEAYMAASLVALALVAMIAAIWDAVRSPSVPG